MKLSTLWFVDKFEDRHLAINLNNMWKNINLVKEFKEYFNLNSKRKINKIDRVICVVAHLVDRNEQYCLQVMS